MAHDRPAAAGKRLRADRATDKAVERSPAQLPAAPKEWMGEWGPSARAPAPESPERPLKPGKPARAGASRSSARAGTASGGAPRSSARIDTAAVGSARALGQAPKPVAVGEWLWACRAGSEPDLCDELRTHAQTGRVVQPALVATAARPRNPHKEDVELAFARQGLPVQALGPADAESLAALIGKLTADRRFTPEGSGLALHVFSPDSDEGNLRAGAVLALQARLTEVLAAAGIPLLADGKAAHDEGGRLIQVCLLDDDKVALGVLPARAAPSLFPGGRQRYKKPKDAPARSALKLVEALAWLGHGPEAGEVCVDLGAAPGGWSQVLLERRCHVVAIDPGRMAPHLTGRLEHLRMNAFSFEPELPAEWVLCDMAYRPLEVAGLLAKWGRHRWAQFLLANIKLPMTRRVDMLARVREILATGGWTGLRMRQLYHDRDEITLYAWRGFGIDTRVPQHRAPPGAAPTEFERTSDYAPGRAAARSHTGSPQPAGKKPYASRSERSSDAPAGRAPARGRTDAPAGRKPSAGRSERSSDSPPGRARGRTGAPKPAGRKPAAGRPERFESSSDSPPSRAPARGRAGAPKPAGQKPSAGRSERSSDAPAGRSPRPEPRGRTSSPKAGAKKPPPRGGRPARGAPPAARGKSPRPRR